MEENKIISYKDLIVWQRSMSLVTEVYKLTERYPNHEIYGLTAHTRKTAVSIPSNIAEGKARGTRKDYCRFMIIAFGSCAELETQLLIAKNLALTSGENFEKVEALLLEVNKMLRVLVSKLRT